MSFGSEFREFAVKGSVVDGGLDLHLGQEVDDVLGPSIKFGVALLASKALDLGDRQAGHADLAERLAHFLELERLDDGNDELHGLIPEVLAIRSMGARTISASERIVCKTFLPFTTLLATLLAMSSDNLSPV